MGKVRPPPDRPAAKVAIPVGPKRRAPGIKPASGVRAVKGRRDLRAELAAAQAKAAEEAAERARVVELLYEISTASGGVLDVAKLADL